MRESACFVLVAAKIPQCDDTSWLCHRHCCIIPCAIRRNSSKTLEERKHCDVLSESEGRAPTVGGSERCPGS